MIRIGQKSLVSYSIYLNTIWYSSLIYCFTTWRPPNTSNKSVWPVCTCDSHSPDLSWSNSQTILIREQESKWVQPVSVIFNPSKGKMEKKNDKRGTKLKICWSFCLLTEFLLPHMGAQGRHISLEIIEPLLQLIKHRIKHTKMPGSPRLPKNITIPDQTYHILPISVPLRPNLKKFASIRHSPYERIYPNLEFSTVARRTMDQWPPETTLKIYVIHIPHKNP